MKRAIAMSLCALSLSGIIPAAGAANTVTATPTESLGQTVMYDNWPVGISAYNIANNNYFKLRDLGNLLDFAVDYDAATQTVTLGDLSTSYTLVEGEQAKELRDIGGLLKWFVGAPKGMVQPMPATISDSKFSMNGKPVSIAAYSIGGNNYVKLRDVSELVGFGVDFTPDRAIRLSVNEKTETIVEQPTANTPSTSAGSALTVTDEQLRAWELQMVDRINEERRKAGLNELTIDENLMEVSQYWAQHLTADFRHSTWSEIEAFAESIGANPNELGSFENCTGAGRLTELAVEMGFDYMESAMENFMNSTGHRNAILHSEMKRVGVGFAIADDGNIYCCQTFDR